MRNNRQLNPQQLVDFMEACISHTFREHSAHGLLVCFQEAVSSYWQYLGAVINDHDGDETSLKPTERRHYQICASMYESFDPVVSDSFTRTREVLPRDYPCPVCKDEEPSDPPGPDDIKKVDWEDADE